MKSLTKITAGERCSSVVERILGKILRISLHTKDTQKQNSALWDCSEGILFERKVNNFLKYYLSNQEVLKYLYVYIHFLVISTLWRPKYQRTYYNFCWTVSYLLLAFFCFENSKLVNR